MNRNSVAGELVVFKDAEEFHHDGILYREEGNSITVVHVHGSFGNFYQNGFLRVMAKTYLANGINFLSFNLAGHDAVAEGYRHEWDFEYAGGAVTEFNRCIWDIQAAIDFVEPFSQHIILQGHSIGCDRILHYLIEKRASYGFILLSPCDSYQLQANWIAPETVAQQIHRLKMQKPPDGAIDWLPTREYGIRQRDWEYPIHITRPSLLSIMEGPPFRLMRLDEPASFRLDQRALMYIGGDDALQTAPLEKMLGYLRVRIPGLTMTASHPDGDHSLWGCEREVSEEIVKWILS